MSEPVAEKPSPQDTVATRGDVETSLMRALTLAEGKYVDGLLARVESRVAARAPGLVERCASEPVTRALLAEVEAEAVARVFRADGAIYTSETEGDYSYSLNSSVASAALRITEEEWARLQGALRSLRPSTDAYLLGRDAGLSPELRFQRGWPGEAFPSEGL